MSTGSGKDDIADGLFARPLSRKPAAVSPKKTARKARSKSIGPGALNELDLGPLKETTANRRKSAFIPAVRSILASSGEDEKQRREERRKSMATRRVSFAPEATLHTWDVIEYMREATSSSASSDATRRTLHACAQADASPDLTVGESGTLPHRDEQAGVARTPTSQQRDAHAKAHRRRNSGPSPVAFDCRDHPFLSSPLNGKRGSDHGQPDSSRGPPVEVLEASANDSPVVSEDSDSSHRLNEALRQAAAHAGTQRLDCDEDDDVSMELTSEDLTASFKGWGSKPANASPSARPSIAKNTDSMVPSYQISGDEQDGDAEDISMDITHALGRIVSPPSMHDSNLDASMDFTMPLGNIRESSQGAERDRKSLKRAHSPLLFDARESPAKRRPGFRQHLSEEDTSVGEQTMDFTIAMGRIQCQHALAAQNDNSVVNLSSEKQLMSPAATTGPKKVSDMQLSIESTTVMDTRQLVQPPEAVEDSTPSKIGITVNAGHDSPLKLPTRSQRTLRLSSGGIKGQSLSPRKLPRTASQPSNSPPEPLSLATAASTSTPEQQLSNESALLCIRDGLSSAPKQESAKSTPPQQVLVADCGGIPNDPVAAPLLTRRRSSLSSVHFSPIPSAREEPTLKSTAFLTNSMKSLSTPRKQTLSTPTKRAPTPKKAVTPHKQSAPIQTTSHSRQRVLVASPREAATTDQEEHGIKECGDPITLQKFLDMTNIRFMDLTTTRRRHTAAPSALHTKGLPEDQESLDGYVAAAACTVPEFEMFHHACHELKTHISQGRNIVRQIEDAVLEDSPALFREYVAAPQDQRAVMDNQFKDLKTWARIETKGTWYGWRGNLLRDLKAGLCFTVEDFDKDDAKLREYERMLSKTVPPMVEQSAQLERECAGLQQRQDDLDSCDVEELKMAREKLLAADAELEGKRRLLTALQEDAAHKATLAAAAKERKTECLGELEAAERMWQDCRGWSASEIMGLKAQVVALEDTHGWSVASATTSPPSVTMAYLDDVELTFKPTAFCTGEDTPNDPISLRYIGGSSYANARPLATTKRFFLQGMQAYVQCLSQSQTSIAELLAFIKKTWTAALSVVEGVEWLTQNHVTQESILSDEHLTIQSAMMLPSLQTKVCVTFDVSVNLAMGDVEARVSVKAEVVYGESYKADRMSDFLKQLVGDRLCVQSEMMAWADAVAELAQKLEKRGRKGQRL